MMVFTNLIKNNSKKIIISIGLLFLLVISLNFLYPYAVKLIKTNSNNQNGSNTNSNNQNPFQNIKDPKSVLMTEMKKVYGPAGDYWDNWDIKYNIVFAHIVEIDLANKEILADIKPPNFEPFSYETKRVYVACPANQTIEVPGKNPTESIISENFNILNKAEIGDIILGYCSDEQCLNIGKACALVKTNFEM